MRRAKLVRSSVTDFVKIAGLVEEDTSGVALEDREPEQKAALRARSQVELARFSEELDSGAAAAVSEDAASA